MVLHKLLVKIKRASSLADSDGLPFTGHSDPYVRLRIVDAEGKNVKKVEQTRVLNDTGNPEWNEDFTYTFRGDEIPTAHTLCLNVLDKDHLVGKFGDKLNSDDDLGDAKVELGTLKDTKEWQDFNDVPIAGWIWRSGLTFSLCTNGMWGNGPVENNKLTVTVKKATGLRDTDGILSLSGKIDPYVMLTIVDSNGSKIMEPKFTTVKDEGGSDVAWNEEFVFEALETPGAYRLKVNVYDKDSYTRDDDLGDATIHLGTLKNTHDVQEFNDLIIAKREGSKLSIDLCNNGSWGHGKGHFARRPGDGKKGG